jgi:LytS/YehU family sensor histidine kinase
MRSKYGNKKAKASGKVFDSRLERSRYYTLQVLEKAGEISELRMQVPFEIIPAIYETVEVQLKTKTKQVQKLVQRATHYVADFVYKDKDGNVVVEDSKGFRTKEYLLKKKMMRAFLGITIKEV